MSNQYEEHNMAGEMELSAEDLAWIEKYKDDPEFSGETAVDMGDEPHPVDEADDGKGKEEAGDDTTAKAEAVQEDEAAETLAHDTEAAEQKLYADLLELNDKQEALKDDFKAAEATLKAAEKALVDLAIKMDDGELGQAEYEVQKAGLGEAVTEAKAKVKQLKDAQHENQRLLEDAADKVDTVAKAADERKQAAEEAEAQGQQQWIADCQSFLDKPENTIFKDNLERQEDLSECVRTVIQRITHKGQTLSNAEILTQARKMAAALYDDIPAVKEEKATAKKPAPVELPVTLGRFNAAGAGTVSNNDFADFDKMSPAERDAALLAIPRDQLKRMGGGG